MAITKVVRLRRGEVPHNVRSRGGDTRPALNAEGIEAYDKLSLEEVKTRAEKQLEAQHVKQYAQGTFDQLGIFLDDHAELAKVDASRKACHCAECEGKQTVAEHNRRVFVEELQSPENIQARRRAGRTGVTEYNYYDWSNAYAKLRAQGKLYLDANEIHKQEVAAQRAAIDAQNNTNAWEMPMDELERVSNGVPFEATDLTRKARERHANFQND